MLAILGEVTFELLDGPRAMRQSYRWDYVAQPVIEDVPKLQWVADGLSSISLEMLLHRSFTDPNTQLSALLAAASDHRARPLIFGNGDLQGYFVLTELSTTYEQLSADGDLVAIVVRTQLMQWKPSLSDSEATLSPAFTPIAALGAPPGVDTSTVSIPQAVGVAPQIIPSSSPYTLPDLPEAGTSLLLRSSTQQLAAPGVVVPNDIPASQIVRAGT